MGMIGQLQVEPGRLIVTPHPMLLDGQRNVVWEARAGESLYAILQRNVPELDGQRWDVCIGGRAVERHLWHHVYPKQGQVIEVRGGVGRSALALVAVLALTYFTFGFGAATAGMWGAGAVAGSWGAMAAAGVYMAGSMLINKVLAPKPPKVDNRQQDSVYSISGARNQLRPYEPFPLLFGRAQITPDLLSKPYTWYEGNDQFLGLLLSAGINVGRIEALYNGDTPLSNYEGVQVYHAGYSQMPEQAIPLAQAREKVIAAVHAHRAEEAAKKAADALLAKLQGGQTLQALAEGEKLQLMPMPGLPRTAPMPTAAANRAVFSVAPPAGDKPSYGKVELDGGRYAVFAVTKVTPGDLKEVPEPQLAMLKQQLSQIDGAAAAKAFVDGLRKRFKVQVQESQL